MNKKENKSETSQMVDLANRLDALERQNRINNREIAYVQAIVRELRSGNLEEAQEIALREGDKIVDLSEIKRLIIDELFAGSVDESLIPKDFGR